MSPPPKIDTNSETAVRAGASRARTDMRSLAVALESYQIDHNAYPPALAPNLTTPIAYIRYIPFDPFSTEAKTMRYELTEGKRWLLWSVGPDRVDDKGKIEYDPANGTVSKGDITRRNQLQ